MSDPNFESPEAAKARRARSIAIAVGLFAFVVLVFVVSIVKMSAHVPHAS